jgi:hypothetical protein
VSAAPAASAATAVDDARRKRRNPGAPGPPLRFGTENGDAETPKRRNTAGSHCSLSSAFFGDSCDATVDTTVAHLLDRATQSELPPFWGCTR